eukprot:gene421-277_t
MAVSEAKRWQSFGSGRFLGMSTLLLSSENANHGHADKTPENLGKEKRPWKFVRFEEVKSSIESSDSIEEALNAAEEIPAIQRSADRAMKIMSADVEDAILALRVLFKISNIVAASSLQSGMTRDDLHVTDLSVVSRIEHVADCVALNLRQLSAEDLIVAAWSLNTIKLDNQEYIEAVMNEYGHRITEFWADKASGAPLKLRIDDIAAMIWTVGSHRDQYGWSNLSLINDLVRAFSEYHGTSLQSFAQLDPRMNIRILWAMSLFNILRHHQDFTTQGVSTILPSLSELTSTNKVSMLWCAARARLANASIVVPVINAVNDLLLTKPQTLREHELNYILLASRIMNERMRRLLMDHKCNITAPSLSNSHLTLDEAEILKATEKMMRSFVTFALPAINQHSFQANLNILRVLGRMELLDEDQATFKAYYDRFREKVESALAIDLNTSTDASANPLISPTDAADILEIIATTVEYPGLLQGELANVHLRRDDAHLSTVETGHVVAVEEKTWLPKAISTSVGVSNIIRLSSVSTHRWHELMGKLGVYISCYRKDVSDRTTFVHAAWALARMGHALKPLCRKAKTFAEYQKLPELPIQVLGRLVVVLASEQSSLINNAASVKSSAASYDLIARVSTTILSRLHEVTLLSDLSQILFSVAFLGRLPHQSSHKPNSDPTTAPMTPNTTAAVSSSSSASPSSPPLQKQISLRPLQLMFLSTEEIIGLHWSTRQLAADHNLHVFDGDTNQRLIQEVQRRLPVYLVSPATATATATTTGTTQQQNQSSAMDTIEQQTMNFKDSFLLVKSLSNAVHVHDRSLDPLKDQPLDQALEMHVSVLIDALQAFIDLRWFKEDMITTCELALSRVRQVLADQQQQQQQQASSAAGTESSSGKGRSSTRMLRLADSHVLHFQCGVLGQLLSIYRELPVLLAANEEVPVGKMPAKKKPATMVMAHFPRLNGLFSRFLGTVPASVASDQPAPANATDDEDIAFGGTVAHALR